MEEVTLRNINQDYRTKESYKTLRTNIEFSGEDRRAIVFTSCTPGEGKSTVSLSLSESLADSGKSVLFIDADLRKSVLAGRHHVTGNIRGLSHYLTGQAEMKDVIVQTQFPNLHMIFAGVLPPNPAELLGGKRFESLLQRARKEYNYVIVDAPPLGSVIDAAVIARYCDGAVLVLAVKSVSYQFARSNVEQLEKANCPILGVVLNKVDMKQDKYYGRYYGKYYGEYYGEY